MKPTNKSNKKALSSGVAVLVVDVADVVDVVDVVELVVDDDATKRIKFSN